MAIKLLQVFTGNPCSLESTLIFIIFIRSVYKFGLLSTLLLFRYFSLCSNFQLFHLEATHLPLVLPEKGEMPRCWQLLNLECTRVSPIYPLLQLGHLIDR